MPLLDEEIFKVGYPVAFRPGGDTTREAFGKHIDEIKKIYGNLRALNQAAASAGSISSALQGHINSTNPHPNWKPKFSFDDITGDLDASRVKGKLTNATIDASNVNNLSSFVNKLIPKYDDKGDGITDESIEDNGYVKFNNGLIFQWGNAYSGDSLSLGDKEYEVKFAQPFSQKCLNVTLCMEINEFYSIADINTQLIKSSITTTGFSYILQFYWKSVDQIGGWASEMKVGASYFAIGK